MTGFFLLAYITEDELLTVHVYAGYAVTGLIVFRLIWGLIGTRHARFSDFVTGPTGLMRYLGKLVIRLAREIGFIEQRYFSGHLSYTINLVKDAGLANDRTTTSGSA